jgi:nitrate reductase NapAB chaperone NapD
MNPDRIYIIIVIEKNMRLTGIVMIKNLFGIAEIKNISKIKTTLNTMSGGEMKIRDKEISKIIVKIKAEGKIKIRKRLV